MVKFSSCVKCGAPKDYGEECPNCGVYYEKAEAAFLEKREEKEDRRRREEEEAARLAKEESDIIAKMDETKAARLAKEELNSSNSQKHYSCSSCGSGYSGDPKFCSECGHELHSASDKSTKASKTINFYKHSIYKIYDSIAFNIRTISSESKKLHFVKKNKIFSLLLIMTLVFWSLVTSSLLFTPNPESSTYKTSAGSTTTYSSETTTYSSKTRSYSYCYDIGKKYGRCAYMSFLGQSCDPADDIIIPAECRNRSVTEEGIVAGTREASR